MQPTRNFLAEIHFITAIAEFFDLHRFKPFHHPVGRTFCATSFLPALCATRPAARPSRRIPERTTPVVRGGRRTVRRNRPRRRRSRFRTLSTTRRSIPRLRSVRIGYMQFPKSGATRTPLPNGSSHCRNRCRESLLSTFSPRRTRSVTSYPTYIPVLPEIILDRDSALSSPGRLPYWSGSEPTRRRRPFRRSYTTRNNRGRFRKK